MSFLSGLLGGKSKRTAPAAVSGLLLQSSTYGSPVGLVYGTTRVAPNLIWYGDFQAIPFDSSAGAGGKGGVGGGGGGKGGGGSTSYNYQTAVAMALCEGPIQGVGNAYVDKNVTTPAALGLSTFLGTYPQTPWGYLSTNHNGAITESHTIPGSGPYRVTVAEASDFIADQGVTGAPITVVYRSVAGSPGTQQYTVNHNVYTFSSINAGTLVVISYSTAFGVARSQSLPIPVTAPYQLAIQDQYAFAAH